MSFGVSARRSLVHLHPLRGHRLVDEHFSLEASAGTDTWPHLREIFKIYVFQSYSNLWFVKGTPRRGSICIGAGAKLQVILRNEPLIDRWLFTLKLSRKLLYIGLHTLIDHGLVGHPQNITACSKSKVRAIIMILWLSNLPLLSLLSS